jgi:hypothetical protein
VAQATRKNRHSANPSNRHSYRATFLHKSEWLKFSHLNTTSQLSTPFDQIIKRPYSPAVDSSSAGGKATPSEEQKRQLFSFLVSQKFSQKTWFSSSFCIGPIDKYVHKQASSQALEENQLHPLDSYQKEPCKHCSLLNMLNIFSPSAWFRRFFDGRCAAF